MTNILNKNCLHTKFVIKNLFTKVTGHTKFVNLKLILLIKPLHELTVPSVR